MRFRILLIANLFLISLLVWPPGGSLLEFRQATYDMLLRMTAAIWIWVALVLASEYHLLQFLNRRRDRPAGAEGSAGAQSKGWREGAPEDRRGGDRRSADRRKRSLPLPEGMPGRRTGGDRRTWWRRKRDHAAVPGKPPAGSWR